jgi:hypothetical protein
MTLAGQIIVPGVSRKGDILTRAEVLEQAYTLGRRAVSYK